jgi:hypothetical protein
MARMPNHGARLTDEEYERRIVDLHRGLPPVPTRSQDREVRRRALDLAIDHRLGQDFPRDRREALWAASERVDRSRTRLGLRYLIEALLRPTRRRHAEALTRTLAAEYSKVLSPVEVERLLGLEAGEHPTLPVDLMSREK